MSRASGLALLAASALLFGVMVLLVKSAAGHGVPGPEVAFFRFAITLLAVAARALRGPALAFHNRRALALRGLFGGLAVLGLFVAIDKLPVGIATLLNYTQPIPTAIFAALFLGERLRASTVAALVVTTLGVYLVVRGHSTADPAAALDGTRAARAGFGRWELVGLASSLASGAAVTAIRWGRRTDGAWEVLGAFGAIGALVCLPLTLRHWVTPSPVAIALLVATGAVSVLAQLLYTTALGHVNAASAGVVSQLTPVSALALGVLVLADPLSPLAALGAAVTLGGVILGAVLRA